MAIRSTQGQNRAVRSTQGQNRAVRSMQGGSHPPYSDFVSVTPKSAVFIMFVLL